MTTHKVAELEGALLDAAVAKAACVPFELRADGCYYRRLVERFHEELDRRSLHVVKIPIGPEEVWAPCNPSSNWEIGGPIIERERITVAAVGRTHKAWFAGVGGAECDSGVEVGYGSCSHEGPTPLIAAMRAFVESKLGEEVEL